MASKGLKVSKQGTAGKSPQKLDRIRWFESGKSQSVIMASYTIESSTIYDTKKHKGWLWSFMAWSRSVMGLLKLPDIETF